MKNINKSHDIREEIKSFINFSAGNPHPVLRAALDGTILYANPVGTLLIQNWNCDVGQFLPSPFYQSVIDVLGTKSTKKEVEITCKDQIFSFTIVRVPDNDFVNLYGVNITKHKQIEEKLMILNKSLEQRIIKRTATLEKTNEELQIKIIEYKKAEEEITLLQTITASIAEADNFYLALNMVLRKICEFTGWVYGEAWTPSSDSKYLTCNTVWHHNFEKLERFKEKSQMFTFPPGVDLPGRVWSSKKPEWKQDITVSVDFPRAKFARELGLKAAMGIPVMDNDKVVAVLIFFMNEHHNKDKHLVKLVSSIANQLGAIIQRKQAKEALRMTESKYQLLLENLPQLVSYKDRNSVYVSCNKNKARDLHIKPEEISGKTDYDFFPEEIAEKYRTDDKKVIESGQTIDVDEAYIRNGQELVVHTIKVPIKDEKGNIVGILGSSLDITEKVNLERQAERSKHLVLLGELAAGIAHEINNPINGVINYAQILSNKSADGSREKDIAVRILKEGDRIANIVYSLLSLAKPKKGVKNSISIHEVLSETLILTETQLRKEGIKLKLDTPPKYLAKNTSKSTTYSTGFFECYI